jgi:hypothetical protein
MDRREEKFAVEREYMRKVVGERACPKVLVWGLNQIKS